MVQAAADGLWPNGYGFGTLLCLRLRLSPDDVVQAGGDVLWPNGYGFEHRLMCGCVAWNTVVLVAVYPGRKEC